MECQHCQKMGLKTRQLEALPGGAFTRSYYCSCGARIVSREEAMKTDLPPEHSHCGGRLRLRTTITIVSGQVYDRYYQCSCAHCDARIVSREDVLTVRTPASQRSLFDLWTKATALSLQELEQRLA